MKYSDAFLHCRNCLVFWPKNIEVPSEIQDRHAVVLVDDPHNAFAYFFQRIILYIFRLLMKLRLLMVLIFQKKQK